MTQKANECGKGKEGAAGDLHIKSKGRWISSSGRKAFWIGSEEIQRLPYCMVTSVRHLMVACSRTTIGVVIYYMPLACHTLNNSPMAMFSPLNLYKNL